MKINHLLIKRFGGYSDTSLSFRDGFTLFSGNNESGKTTLKNFMQQMLYGFASLKSPFSYPPFDGGKPSGNLTFSLDDLEQYQIQRESKKITVLHPDKTTSSKEINPALWNNIDKNTFQQIFCMDIKEWNGLSLMNEEDLQNRFLSASFGIKSLSNALKQIQKKHQDIFKKGGRKQVLHTLHKELTDLKQEIRKAKQIAGEYASWGIELDSLEIQIQEQQAQIEKLNIEISKRTLWSNTKNDWLSYSELQRRMESIPYSFDKNSFPPQLLEQAKQWISELEKEKETVTELEKNLVKKEETLQGIHLNKKILEKKEVIAQLVEQKKQFIKALEDYPRIQDQTNKTRANLETQLKQIDPNWTKKDIEKTTMFSIEEQAKIKSWKSQYAALEQEEKKVTYQIEQETKLIQELQIQMQQLQARYNECNQKVLVETKLHKMKSYIPSIAGFISKFEYLSREEWEENLTNTKQFPAWVQWGSIGVTVGSIVLLTLFHSNLFLSYLLWGVGAVGLYYLIQSFRNNHSGTNTTSNKREQIAKLQKEALSFFKENNLSIPEFSIAHLSEMVESLQSTIQKQNDLALQMKQMAVSMQTNTDAVQIKHNHLSSLEQTQKEIRQTIQQCQNDFSTWKKTHSLSSSLSVVEIDPLISSIKEAQYLLNNVVADTNRKKEIETYITNISNHIQSIFKDVEIEIDTNNINSYSISLLQEKIEENESFQKQQEDCKNEIHYLSLDKEKSEKQIQNLTKKVNQIFKTTNTEDIFSLEEKTSSYSEYKKLLDESNQLYNRLYGKAGNKDQWEQLHADLETTDFQENERILLDLTEQKKELENEVHQKLKQQGELQNKRVTANSDTKLGSLLQEKESIEQQIQLKGEEWLSYTLAYSFIQKTKTTFEQKQQPGVIKFASDWINELTNHRYHLMKTFDSDTEKENFVLYDTTQNTTMENQWSGGLADQVYFAIRMGLIHELSEHGETLPLFLDDVLIRFDPSRQIQAARLLLQLSEKHQIFYFSCHPQIESLFQDVAQNLSSTSVTTYSLDNFSILNNSMEESNENTMANLFT